MTDKADLPEIVIDRMTESDLHQVIRIERASFPTPWTIELFHSELTNPLSRYWVARSENKVVGYIGILVVPADGQITTFAVNPDHRLQGIGTKLLEFALSVAVSWGLSAVTLEVRETNLEAQILYRSFGFEELGLREGYYAEINENAVVMGVANLQDPKVWSRFHKEELLGQQRELILSVETSCDETSLALMRGGVEVIASLVSSQIELHTEYGGVVPELAARRHLEQLNPLLDELMNDAKVSWSDIDAVAVTLGPGLVIALLVGAAAGKAIAFANGVPLIGLNHLEGHIAANYISHPHLEPPALAHLMSGGHTMLIHMKNKGDYEVIGQTVDDAVGEAFDKVGAMLNLGYPGGPAIDRLAANGDPTAYPLPRAMAHSKNYDFSLSGLKTAVRTLIEKEEKRGVIINVPDLCASFQAAVFDVQIAKALKAAKALGLKDILLSGGVAANTYLRAQYSIRAKEKGVKVYAPPLSLCTDNAVMMGVAAHWKYVEQDFINYEAAVDPNMKL